MENEEYTKLSEKYINGSGGATDDINPATGRSLVRIRSMTTEDAREAIEKAAAVYSAWSSMTPPARGRIIYRAGEIIEREKESLARLICNSFNSA